MSATPFPNFEVRIPGKWLLTGEHSVIRGATAIAMPHSELALTLRFQADHDPSQGFQVEPFEIIPVLNDAFAAANLERPASGKLSIQSTIPIGAGMGSSAALCVAITRWLSGPANLKSETEVAFATALENRFHGRSSGVDVAVVSAGEPLSFVRGQKTNPLGLSRLPKFTFHDTGLRANTHDCVAQVERYLARHPEKGALSEERMASASLHAIEGLKTFDQGNDRAGLEMLTRAMNLAHESFMEWDLVPASALALRNELLAKGALAVKITGAGGGGMMLALWPSVTA